MIVLCRVCSKEFNTTPANKKRGSGIYCSRVCFNVDRKQKKKIHGNRLTHIYVDEYYNVDNFLNGDYINE